MIRDGKVGIIQTDTSPAFVADLHNSAAVSALYSLKHADDTKKMSILCRDISQMSRYIVGFPQSPSFNGFKAVKKALPGPYTFILNASKEMPKQVLEHGSKKRRSTRRTVGCRVPSSTLVQELFQFVEGPLLTTSVPVGDIGWEKVDYAAFCEDHPDASFIVSEENVVASLSTVVDLTGELPRVLRYGAGDSEPFDMGDEEVDGYESDDE